MTMRGSRHLVHFATGGIGHFLHLLGNTVDFALRTDATVSVVSEYHQPLAQLPFREIFKFTAPINQKQLSKISLPTKGFRPSREKGSIPYIKSPDDLTFVASFLPFGIPDLMRGGYFTSGDPPPGLESGRRLTTGSALAKSLSVLSLQDEFVEEIKSRSKSLSNRFVGVHFRNTDYSSDIESILNRTMKAASEEEVQEIYWCTDDASSIRIAEERLRGLTVRHHQPFESATLDNLHYGIRGEDSVRQLKNTFADLWTLSKSQKFIHSTGSWSTLVPILRDDAIQESFFGVGTPQPGSNLALIE